MSLQLKSKVQELIVPNPEIEIFKDSCQVIKQVIHVRRDPVSICLGQVKAVLPVIVRQLL